MLDVALILALVISGIAKIVVVLISIGAEPDPETELLSPWQGERTEE